MNIPDFKIPLLVTKISQKMPNWPADQLIVLAMNMNVRLGVFPQDALDALEGRVVGFEVCDMAYSTALTWLNGKFWHAETETAELMMRANTAQFLQLLNRQEDPDTLFFNRTLVIEGDTELGLVVKNLLDSIDWSNLSLPSFGGLFKKKADAS